MMPRHLRRRAVAVAAPLAASALFAVSQEASAQQVGFTADRLILAPNPDDGYATARPTLGEKTRLFGSLTLDYIRRPVRASSVTTNAGIQQKYSSGVVSNQGTGFFTVGGEFLNRFSLAVTMPVTYLNTGASDNLAGTTQGINLKPAGAGDLRLDGRLRLFTTDSRSFGVGVAASYFMPTGNEFSFMGDASGHTHVQLLLEERVGPLIINEHFGVHLRNKHDVGKPAPDGLHFQNELTYGAAVFIPLREERVRIGGEIYGSTGLGTVDGQSTTFKGRFTPLEWLGEVRFAPTDDRRLWLGGGAGTLLSPGYSAPDFRVILQVGYWFTLEDTRAPSPPRKFIKDEDRVAEKDPDTDGDGLPDAIDACPTIPEDKQPPDPNDGCPGPKDRDKDGIPDDKDKCPDEPEDRDGFEDEDGCPDPDNDKDGIPDIKDACPKEPGPESKDPKQNGCPQFIRRIEGSNEIQILKKIEFDTGKATIKSGSLPILDEVVKLLAANPQIKKLSIEGHTDSRGAYDMNKKLSQDRAQACLDYLAKKGIESGRLSAQGFGPDKPIDDNKTEQGRARNRRTEFHILE